MKTSITQWKGIVGSVFVAAVGLVCILPILRFDIAPQWSVRVSNERGEPVIECSVREGWQYYGLSGEDSEKKRTDSLGKTVFQPRSLRVSPIHFLLSRCASFLNVHSSFGPTAQIEVSFDGYKHASITYHNQKLFFTDAKVSNEIRSEGIISTVALQRLDLIDAVQKHDVTLLKRLLKENPNSIRMTDSIGYTPLHWAIGSSDLNSQMASLLIGMGADVNAAAKDGTTPLHRAAYTGAIELISLLLSKGANTRARIHDSRLTEDLKTPLHAAVSWANSEEQTVKAVELLIKSGADVNAKDHFSNTPLFLAAYLSGPSVIRTLLSNGANLEIRDSDGNTPLDIANRFNKTDNIRVLKEFSRNNRN